MAEEIVARTFLTMEQLLAVYFETRQPFLYRIFKVENIAINASGRSSPLILVEAIRMRKGVRRIDSK
jgi:hypothetical protein